MGLRGITPKPNAVRILEGTYREDRHGCTLKAPVGLPVKPDWLGPVGSRIWDERISELSEIPGLLSPMDGHQLALYCDAWETFFKADEIVQSDGLLTTGAHGGRNQHPALVVKNQAREAICKIGAKFGMTPTDRNGLKPTGKTADDELSELIA